MTKQRSLAQIASILAAEGFTDHAANEVKRYWRRKVVTGRQQQRIERVKAAFSKICDEKLSGADKIVMGKYIGVLMSAQFDTGLRLGLMTLLFDLEEKVAERNRPGRVRFLSERGT